MRIDYTGKIGINTTSIPGLLTIKGTSSGNAPLLRINADTSNSFVHSTESIAANLTASQTVINVIGKEGTTKQSGWMGYQWYGTGSNDNLLTFGMWGANHLLTINGLGHTNIAGNLTINGNYSFNGLLLNTYTGTGFHELQNGTSNGTVLRLTSTGDNKVLILQTDHIYSNDNLVLGDDSYNTYLRGPKLIGLNSQLGIGVTPTVALQVYQSGDVWHTVIGNDTGQIRIGGQTSSGAVIQSRNSAGTSRDMYLQRDGGNVGIGTNSPYSNAKLQVKTGTNINVAIQTGTTNTSGIKINAFNDAGSANIPLELNGSILSLKTGETSRVNIDSSGNVGVGGDAVSKMQLYYTGGSYGTEATSGFINQATTGRATQRLRSIQDAASEFFFDINGGIRWDISARPSSQGHALNFYPQATNPGYAGVSAHAFALYQNGDAYHKGSVGIGSSATGKLSVIGAGNGNAPVLAIDATNAQSFVHISEMFAGSLSTNHAVISLIGKEGSVKNSGYLGYLYSGTAASDNNMLTLGMWGADHLVKLKGNGQLGIGTTPSYTLDVAGSVRLQGYQTAKLYFDTNGAGASNYIGITNNYETTIYTGRGSAGFASIGNSNLRFGFGANLTLAESKMVILPGGQVNIGISYGYNGTRLSVEGERMGVRTTASSWGQLYVANPNDAEAAIAFGAGGTGRPGGDSTYTRQWIMGIGPYGVGTTKWSLSNKTLQSNPAITIIESTGAMGLRQVSPSYQLDVTGDIRASSDVIAFSDRRVKENIVTIDNALNKVTQLRGVTYTRKDTDDKSTKLGVIAQEVLEVLPEVVAQDKEGMYSVAYGNMAGVFIEAIKELENRIKELENKPCNCK